VCPTSLYRILFSAVVLELIQRNTMPKKGGKWVSSMLLGLTSYLAPWILKFVGDTVDIAQMCRLKHQFLSPFLHQILVQQINGSNDPSQNRRLSKWQRQLEYFLLWETNKQKRLYSCKREGGGREKEFWEITVPQQTATKHLDKECKLGNAFISSQGRHIPHQILE